MQKSIRQGLCFMATGVILSGCGKGGSESNGSSPDYTRRSDHGDRRTPAASDIIEPKADEVFEDLATSKKEFVAGVNNLKYRMSFHQNWDVHTPIIDKEVDGIRLLPAVAVGKIDYASDEHGILSVGFHDRQQIERDNNFLYTKGKNLINEFTPEDKIYFRHNGEDFEVGRFRGERSSQDVSNWYPVICEESYADICSLSLAIEFLPSVTVNRNVPGGSRLTVPGFEATVTIRLNENKQQDLTGSWTVEVTR